MRNVTADMAAEFSAANVRPAILAELYFDSGTIRLWSGFGTLTWNNNQYIGGGNLVAISEIEENQGLEATGLVATLSGVPSNLVATTLLENQRGRPFRLYLAALAESFSLLLEGSDFILTEDGSEILLESVFVDEPYRIFNGLMDTMEIVDTGETSTISVNVESIMITGQRSKIRRYTPEDQKKLFPNDSGLDFIPNLQDKEIVW